MSFKKTWFSYVLWALLTILTIFITFGTMTEITQGIFDAFHVSVGHWFDYIDIGFKILFTGIVAGVCILLHFWNGKVSLPEMSNNVRRFCYILLFFVITAAFIVLRVPAVMKMEEVLLSQQADIFYRSSMIGTHTVYFMGKASLFEQIYLNVLSGLFLFLGNKIEVLFYLQIFVQTISFFLLTYIGWATQKGVFRYIPVLFYAVSPFFFYGIENVGPANFWFCIVLAVNALICLLERVWKKKGITYILLVTAELAVAIMLYIFKADVLLFREIPFTYMSSMNGFLNVLNVEMLVLAVFLIFYAVSFWFHEKDQKALFILPLVLQIGFTAWLALIEYDSICFMFMMALFTGYILFAESFGAVFVTEKEKTKGTDLVEDSVGEELALEDSVSEDGVLEDSVPEDTGVIRVSDILKAAKAETDTGTDNPAMEMENLPMETVDKTAMIENVLPMPKKHVSRSFEYAFEPTEEMMHYDVEVENDDYDYE